MTADVEWKVTWEKSVVSYLIVQYQVLKGGKVKGKVVPVLN
jgi:hypothetical protein